MQTKTQIAQLDNGYRSTSFSAKLKDYAQLFKVRLTALVVFSTFIGYVVSMGPDNSFALLLPLLIGGFLTVASANSLNQIIERRTDRLMTRTLNRPVATNRMSVTEALLASILSGVVGVVLLGYFLNPLSAALAVSGLLIYAFMYTPLKRYSELSVWVGAISGAIPPVVGIAAATGTINGLAITLFVLQFFWQFPHFYAIAWILEKDYKRAGLRLMPFGGRKNKTSAYQILGLTLILIPTGFLAYWLNVGTLVGGIFVAAFGLYLSTKSWFLLKDLNDARAKKLMFASFLYLPVILIIYLIEYLVR